jgi:lipase
MRLALHEWGEPAAPRVVCLHGVTSHGRHFEQLARTALGGFHVLAPDLLGHGSSPYEPPWDLETHRRAIVASVGAEPSFLVGHSFGGRLAFELAARAPKLVPKLVLLDPAIRIPQHAALAAAENARTERSYVSFEEGIERRYDESQLHHAPRESAPTSRTTICSRLTSPRSATSSRSWWYPAGTPSSGTRSARRQMR